MTAFGIAAVAAAALATIAASSAFAGANLQGPQTTGVAVQSLSTGRPVVTAMTLPSGQAVELRRRVGR
ncbi:MAG TPA: hypothetical protein VFQ82_04480 [Stellaceae bacterium]|nr:hypothetical protein [Stellaceae bacterium]